MFLPLWVRFREIGVQQVLNLGLKKKFLAEFYVLFYSFYYLANFIFLIYILGCGAIVCIVGWKAASLVCTHQMPVVLHLPLVVTPKNASRCCQALPGGDRQTHPKADNHWRSLYFVFLSCCCFLKSTWRGPFLKEKRHLSWKDSSRCGLFVGHCWSQIKFTFLL